MAGESARRRRRRGLADGDTVELFITSKGKANASTNLENRSSWRRPPAQGTIRPERGAGRRSNNRALTPNERFGPSSVASSFTPISYEQNEQGVKEWPGGSSTTHSASRRCNRSRRTSAVSQTRNAPGPTHRFQTRGTIPRAAANRLISRILAQDRHSLTHRKWHGPSPTRPAKAADTCRGSQG